MSEVFDRYPEVSRTLYLVDEEFIGRGPDATSRALAVANVLHGEGFRWETSCRIDQVVQPANERSWHLDRAHLWRQLCERGLRRCLFGVESGVTSILTRFSSVRVAGPTRRPTFTEGATANASRENRRAIPVTCALHRGPQGFANLVMERKPNGDIILDPHVTGACVIVFDEAAARALFDVLGTWLRWASTPPPWGLA